MTGNHWNTSFWNYLKWISLQVSWCQGSYCQGPGPRECEWIPQMYTDCFQEHGFCMINSMGICHWKKNRQLRKCLDTNKQMMPGDTREYYEIPRDGPHRPGESQSWRSSPNNDVYLLSRYRDIKWNFQHASSSLKFHVVDATHSCKENVESFDFILDKYINYNAHLVNKVKLTDTSSYCMKCITWYITLYHRENIHINNYRRGCAVKELQFKRNTFYKNHFDVFVYNYHFRISLKCTNITITKISVDVIKTDLYLKSGSKNITLSKLTGFCLHVLDK